MATLTVEQVEQISAKLKELPAVENKKRPVSKQEAIKLLAKDIKAMQARGYTLEQVSEQLKQLGVSLATPTLRSYLKEPEAERQHARKAAKRVVQPLSKISNNLLSQRHRCMKRVNAWQQVREQKQRAK